jgi:hypothetical protein
VQGWEMLLIDIDRRQRRIEGLLYRILKKENIIMADLTNITAAVANETTVEDSAITLIQQLSAAVTAAGTDPVALAALTDQLNTEATSLAAAVTANTPAAS